MSMLNFVNLATCLLPHTLFLLAAAAVHSSSLTSVGLNLGLDSSTGVIAWPNGSSTDAFHLPTKAGDRRWLLDANMFSPNGSVQQGQPRQLPSPLRSSRGMKDGGIELPFLETLMTIERLMNQHLGTGQYVTTVTYPAFLEERQLDHLKHSLHAAKVADSSFHGVATSCTGAAIAYRQRQPVYSGFSPIQRVYGEVGKEHIICIEYNSDILTMESLELVVDERSVYADEKKHMIILRKSDDETVGCFWDRVTRHLRDLLEPSIDIQYPERVYRLVLSGRDAADTRLLRALSNAADELVPSAGIAAIPHVARMDFPTYPRWKELWDETPSQKWPGITCIYDYNPWESQESFYGNALYHRVSQLSHTPDTTASQVSIDPVFASARGAALMGIASLIHPCNDTLSCAFADCVEKQAKPEGWELGLHFTFSSDLAERKRRNETEFEILRNWPVSNTTKERVQAYYREDWLGQNSFRVVRKESFSLREDIKKKATLLWWWFWFL